MNVYLTDEKNNESNDGLEDDYPELYLVYLCIFCLSIMAIISILVSIFPIQCALAFTICIFRGKFTTVPG